MTLKHLAPMLGALRYCRSVGGEVRHYEARSARHANGASPPQSRAAAPYSDLKADPNKTDILVKHILELFNSTGLTAHEAKDVLTHLQVLIEIG
jgi:hypothetical protein